MSLDRRSESIKIWPPCNIYPTATIGENVSIGAFTEIGPNVVIGNNVRIGAMCFIPEGVVIKDDAWIGPRCTFTNDRFPPSPKSQWEMTVVEEGASLGAAVTVLPGIIIGKRSLIGAGSTVTKNTDAHGIYAGNPARLIGTREDRNEVADRNFVGLLDPGFVICG